MYEADFIPNMSIRIRMMALVVSPSALHHKIDLTVLRREVIG